MVTMLVLAVILALSPGLHGQTTQWCKHYCQQFVNEAIPVLVSYSITCTFLTVLLALLF